MNNMRTILNKIRHTAVKGFVTLAQGWRKESPPSDENISPIVIAPYLQKKLF
jgi:hypothetical protein